jgi:acyl transferase domain-containing protein
MWMRWDIRPQALIGHSIGEYVAACLAGVFTLNDALKVVAKRGELMQEAAPGAMLAIGASEAKVRSWMNGTLDLAAANAPELSVVSGPIPDIQELQQKLAAQGIFCHRLNTSHAFHSQMMEPMVEHFARFAAGLNLKAPQIRYVSNLTGTWIRDEEATDPVYWARHLRNTVRFADGIQALQRTSNWILLEVGPGQTLVGLAKQCLGSSGRSILISSLGKTGPGHSEAESLLKALGQLWLHGTSINWRSYYGSEQRRRVFLPTYPFERKRYWIDRPQAGTPSRTLAEVKASGRDLSRWFFIPRWTTSSPQTQSQANNTGGACLLFGSSPQIAPVFEKRLEQLGLAVIRVEAGSAFREKGVRHFVIDPINPEDYTKMLSLSSEAGAVPTHVLHLWNWERDASVASPIEERLRAHEKTFYSLLFLAQALGEMNATRPVRMIVASRGTAVVLDGDSVIPENATALGPCRVIPQEYPRISCIHLDLESSPAGGPVEPERTDPLIRELLSDSEETWVAYRGGARWVRRLQPNRIEAPKQRHLLRERGVYLITGGLGGMGLALAEHLARNVRARLILVSRGGLPERHHWPNWSRTHAAHATTSELIRKVEQIEKEGGEVLAFAGDVADEAQMKRILDEARSRFGALHGIIHAAGVAGGGIIQMKSARLAESVLRPKVRGTLVLEKLCRNEPLDFILLCSSLCSWIGGVGQVDYCAANAFLDAWAASSNRPDRRVISIEWDTWQEAGMALTTAVPRQLEQIRQDSLKYGLTSAEGCEIFERVLTLGVTEPEVAICTKGLTFLEARSPSRSFSQAPGSPPPTPTAGSSSRHPRPDLKNAYVAPRDSLEMTLVKMWEELLGIAPVGIGDNFFELGGHSLLAIQLIAQVKGLLQKELTLRAIFDAPSVEALAQQLRAPKPGADLERMRNLLDVVEQMPEEQVQELLENSHLRASTNIPGAEGQD